MTYNQRSTSLNFSASGLGINKVVDVNQNGLISYGVNGNEYGAVVNYPVGGTTPSWAVQRMGGGDGSGVGLIFYVCFFDNPSKPISSLKLYDQSDNFEFSWSSSTGSNCSFFECNVSDDVFPGTFVLEVDGKFVVKYIVS